MKEYNIASIPGDGIGKEVLPEGLKVLKDAALKHQFKINFTEYDFASCDYYKKHRKMLPDDWKEKLGKHHAIFFGAVGDKNIDDDLLELINFERNRQLNIFSSIYFNKIKDKTFINES